MIARYFGSSSSLGWYFPKLENDFLKCRSRQPGLGIDFSIHRIRARFVRDVCQGWEMIRQLPGSRCRILKNGPYAVQSVALWLKQVGNDYANTENIGLKNVR